VNSFQPLFVLIFGIVLTLFLPDAEKESLNRTKILQKGAGIGLDCRWFLDQQISSDCPSRHLDRPQDNESIATQRAVYRDNDQNDQIYL
jgi:hypothetical protein